MSQLSNPLWLELTPGRKARLLSALRNDDTMEWETWKRTVLAVGKLPDGTMLPYELPNGSDGETDEERVSIALDYYGVA